MKSRRAFMLVLCLLTLTLLLVGGIGLMSVQKFQYRAASSDVLRLQAFLLARSGLDDARLKLDRDPSFPPIAAMDQLAFTYSEQVSLSSGQLGFYTVTIDRSYCGAPYYVLRVASVGRLGPSNAPTAQRTLHIELNQNPSQPNYWQWINFQDDGSL